MKKLYTYYIILIFAVLLFMTAGTAMAAAPQEVKIQADSAYAAREYKQASRYL